MSVAKRVLAIVFEIRLPVVMAQNAFEFWNNAHSIHSQTPPLFMGIKKSPKIIRGRM